MLDAVPGCLWVQISGRPSLGLLSSKPYYREMQPAKRILQSRQSGSLNKVAASAYFSIRYIEVKKGMNPEVEQTCSLQSMFTPRSSSIVRPRIVGTPDYTGLHGADSDTDRSTKVMIS